MICLIKKHLPVYRNIRGIRFAFPGDAVDILQNFTSGCTEADQHDHVTQTIVKGFIALYRETAEKTVPDKAGARKDT